MNDSIKKGIISLGVIGTLTFGISAILPDDGIPLPVIEDREVIDAVEKGNHVEYAYKGEVVSAKLSQKEIVGLRTSTSYTEQVDETTFKTRTYSAPTFFKENDKWSVVEFATTTKEDFDNKLEVSFLRKLTGKVYAATIFSGAGDGTVRNTNASWEVSHDGITGDYADYTSTTDGAVGIFISPYAIYRQFYPINTNSIPSDAVVISATLSVYANTKTNSDNDGDDWINVVQTSQASETSLATADFDQAGAISNPTEGATRIDLGSITSSAYSTWTLNATGLGWIKRSGEASNCGVTTGWTCLGLREGHDAINSPIVAADYLLLNNSESSGTSQDPYLDITYTIPSSTTGRLDIKGGSSLNIGGTSILQIRQ